MNRIEDFEGIAGGAIQNLYFAGVSMNRSHKLSYYGIGDNSTLRASPALSLYVQMLTGRHFIIDNLKRTDSIAIMKAFIEDREGIPSDKQRV